MQSTKPSTEAKEPAAKKQVLLVDNERDFCVIGSLSLRKVGGWDVLVAMSGEEALPMAREHQPDLILLDVIMPRMDGREVLERLREDKRTCSIPVIFITAGGGPEEEAELMAAGALGVIDKSLELYELSSLIDALWTP